MLNLFKLPFRMNRRVTTTDHMTSDFATGLMANFLKQKRNLSEQELERACEVAMNELETLQKSFGELSPGDSYEAMTAALRRIEQGLNF